MSSTHFLHKLHTACWTSAAAKPQSCSPPCASQCTSAAFSRRTALLGAVLLPQLGSQRGAQALQQQQQQQELQLLQEHALCLANVQADYDRYAPSYDQLDGGAASAALGFPELRQQLLQQAQGQVLEVGIGTGLNLSMYNWSSVTRLTGIDLSAGMLQEAAARIRDSLPGLALLPPDTSTDESSSSDGGSDGSSGSSSDGSSSSGGSSDGSSSSGSRASVRAVRLLQADVSRLPFRDSSFDAVADTFSLCVFPDPVAALGEMLRVLKPGGSLLLLEHTRSDNLLLGAYQGATRSLVAPISKGCDWGQDVPGLLAALPGCELQDAQRHLAGTLVSISATKKA